MNKSIDRFHHHLNVFEEKLNESLNAHLSNTMVSPGQFLYALDARTPLFQLQGLARIEKKAGKEKEQAEVWLLHAKELEDAIGKYDYWVSMVQNNKRWRFPDRIERHFKLQCAQALGVLEERLIKMGWIQKDYTGHVTYSPEGAKKFRKSLKKADFHNSTKERKKLLELFRDEAQEIHDKIVNKELDLEHVEFGIHEFRRNTRWLGIYASALLGKVRLNEHDDKLPLHHFVTSQRTSSKHNQLPIHENQDAPLYFLTGGFYAMSELISGLGDIKDPGLATEEMTRIGQYYGLPSATIRKHLGKDYQPHAKVVKEAKAMIHRFVVKEKLFTHIADHFDRQLK